MSPVSSGLPCWAPRVFPQGGFTLPEQMFSVDSAATAQVLMANTGNGME
ncbi:hypothetical protein ACQK5W_00660 [Pantoea sp. FN060301]